MSTKKQIMKRLSLIYGALLVFVILVIAKHVYLLVSEGNKWREMGALLYKEQLLMPLRGDICASDGRVLVSTLPYCKLYFDATTVKDDKDYHRLADSLSKGMAQFFKEKTAEQYKRQLLELRKKKKKYALLDVREVFPHEFQLLKKMPLFKSGLMYRQSRSRISLYGDLGRRTLGYRQGGSENKEVYVGLEAAFDSYLKGIPGLEIVSGGKKSFPQMVKRPEDGCDVITTIDIDFQDIVHEVLVGQLEKFQASHGSVVLMEVKTGDIKAIANLEKQKSGAYEEGINLAVQSRGEPGSVVKAATIIALLEDGFVNPEDTIDLGGKGYYQYYDRKMYESDNKKPGKVTVQMLVENSYNGISQLVVEHYKGKSERFVNRLSNMGLDKVSGVCLEGEREPYINRPGMDSWSGTSLPWLSIGYESALTPLQVLAFYNAIANDGQRMRPRLVKEIREGRRVVKKIEPEEIGSRICSRSTLEKVRAMLEGVVERGTGRNIRTAEYKIAGKTGTSQISQGADGYQKGNNKTTFVGYFPADKPLYSCVVVIDSPLASKGSSGSRVAGPVFREIADKVYAKTYMQHEKEEEPKVKTLPVSKNGLKEDFVAVFDKLDMPLDGLSAVADSEWVTTSSTAGEHVELQPRNVLDALVPNVVGMGLRDAVYLLEKSGLKVKCNGSGMVASQSLRAGTKAISGSEIHIELR